MDTSDGLWTTNDGLLRIVGLLQYNDGKNMIMISDGFLIINTDGDRDRDQS